MCTKRTTSVVAFLFSLLVLSTSAHSKTAETKTSQTKPSPSTSESKPLRAKSSPGAKVFFVNLKNGATVSNPIHLKFGAKGIEIAPAGEVKDNVGHHHLLIDVDPLPSMDQPLPATDKIVHYGKAQTEADITLSPGKHTLQLLLAGGNHIPHNPPVMSKKIKITVK